MKSFSVILAALWLIQIGQCSLLPIQTHEKLLNPHDGPSPRDGARGIGTPRDDSVDNYITMVIENFADAMKTGIPFLGIPILDPFNISVLPIPDINKPEFTLHSNASEISVSDTSSFTPTYVHVDFASNIMYLNLHFIDINVDGWYWCDGMVMYIFPIFGEGSFNIKMVSIDSEGSGGIYTTVDNYLQVSELALNFTYQDFEMFFDNFLGGGSFGEEVNEALSLFAEEIINEIVPLLNESILPALVDFLNSSLLEHTIDEIIAGMLPSFDAHQ